MATFEEHIGQTKHNLTFLVKINGTVTDCYDWQVTVCFYTALHLVNAHLSKYSLQYRQHKDVKNALNFANPLSPARLPEDIYFAYASLQSLSRRSRYLVNEKDHQISNPNASFTYEKHLAKASRHLDALLHHFNMLYHLQISGHLLKCTEIKSKNTFHCLEIK